MLLSVGRIPTNLLEEDTVTAANQMYDMHNDLNIVLKYYNTIAILS